MKKTVQRVFALLLAVSMLGTVTVTAAAGTTNQTETGKTAVFTSTADLIEQTRQRLYEEGKVVQSTSVDQDLADTVEERTGYPYEMVRSTLANAFYENRHGAEGSIDVAYLNLTKDQMKKVMGDMLRYSNLASAVELKYNASNGVVSSIDYTMRESFANGLEEIDNNFTNDWHAQRVEEKLQEAGISIFTDWGNFNWMSMLGDSGNDASSAYAVAYAEEDGEVPEASDSDTCEHDNWDAGKVTKEPTCTEPGEKIYTCQTEGCVATKTEVIPAGHTWDEGVVTTEPTCGTAGKKTYTCTVCEETKTEEISATGAHKYSVVVDDEQGTPDWMTQDLYYTYDYSSDLGYNPETGEFDNLMKTAGEPFVIVDADGNITMDTPEHMWTMAELGMKFYNADGSLKDGYTQMPTLAITYDYESTDSNKLNRFGIAPARMTTIYICAQMTLYCSECGDVHSIRWSGPGDKSIVTESYTCDSGADYGSTFYYATCEVNGVTYSTKGDSERNGTKYMLQNDWAAMCAFNKEFPEYFGVPTSFWTSKDSDSSPMESIKWLCNMNEELFVPDYALQYMAAMLNQAFMSYVMNYGTMADAMLQDALACVEPSMTDIQIYLIMHDWLAKYATFDMQSLVDMTSSGDNSGIEPIGMTVFGTLLSGQDQLEDKNGGICLGYAATYTWLIQSIFKEYGRHGFESYDDFRGNDVVDFVQIKYLTNVAESSVASGGSGFGDGDSMFNSVHYFNAVKLIADGGNKNEAEEDTWYYVDACYDDISTETTSQMRVETLGNISHGNFMLAPETMEDQYEGNFQYIDSLYDGASWVRLPYFDKDGKFVDYYYQDEQGNKLNPLEAEAYKNNNGGQVFYYYERQVNPEEQVSNDTTYETAWFSQASGEIVYDKASGAFYYVETTGGTYTSMKDIMDGDNSDLMDSMSASDMASFRNDPAYADKLRARPVGATDKPSESSDESSSMGGFNQNEDEESIVIFHFGFGTYGEAAQKSADEHSGNMGYGQEEEEYTDEDYGPFRAQVEEGKAYQQMYPDLIHGVAVNDGVVYFNMGNKIFAYSLTKNGGTYKILNSSGEKVFPKGDITQLKEYTDVTYYTDGRPFTGMSFTTDVSERQEGTDKFSLRYHPIASISLRNEIQWKEEEDATGETVQKYRDLTPTLYVSIGTNFSNSYKGESGEAYTEEAVNYNPEYVRFMDDDDDDNENTNTEFMWCANVVDKMVMKTILSDKTMQEVTVDSWCEKAGFTEKRSEIYGLSDGTTKTELESDPAQYHTYEVHPIDKTLVCTQCLKPHDATIEQPNTDEDGNVTEYVDTHLHTDCEPTFTWSREAYKDEDGLTQYRDVCVATTSCEEEYCNRNNPETNQYPCTVENGVATVEIDDVTYTNTKAMLGDVNGDGKVSISDVAKLLRYVKDDTSVEIDLSAADVNGDGKVSISDVAKLLRYVKDPENVILG